MTRSVKSLLRTIQLLFLPTAFLEAEVEHNRALNPKQSVQRANEFRLATEKRIEKKRKGLFISLFIVAVLVLLGFAAATIVNCFNPLPNMIIRWVRVASFTVIAWSVLGRFYESPTIDGDTLLEVTSVEVFKQFYRLGVFLSTFALSLEGPSV
jgi:hypothetical protein